MLGLALAPISCRGIWFAVAYFSGGFSLAEMGDLVASSYRDGAESAVTALRRMVLLQFEVKFSLMDVSFDHLWVLFATFVGDPAAAIGNFVLLVTVRALAAADLGLEAEGRRRRERRRHHRARHTDKTREEDGKREQKAEEKL